MPILNYTTTIDAEKSIMEIQKVLVKGGATKITTDYENGMPKSVTFCMVLNGTIIGYSLPANYKGVLRAMSKDSKVPKKSLTEEQDIRVSWRIVKDWVEAQVAIVQAELASMPEIFLPYAITTNGITLYEEISKGNFKYLSAHEKAD